MLQTEVVQNIKTHILCSMTSENRAVYEITWKNMVERGRPDDNIIRRMRIACWIPKATNTHSDHEILNGTGEVFVHY
jgi:hypothetical protein